jgi:hypothetical protein
VCSVAVCVDNVITPFCQALLRVHSPQKPRKFYKLSATMKSSARERSLAQWIVKRNVNWLAWLRKPKHSGRSNEKFSLTPQALPALRRKVPEMWPNEISFLEPALRIGKE